MKGPRDVTKALTLAIRIAKDTAQLIGLLERIDARETKPDPRLRPKKAKR